MPTFKYYMSGYVTERVMNFILHDLPNPAKLIFHPDLYPITIKMFERAPDETRFNIVFTEKAGVTFPDYYLSQLNAAKPIIANSRDSYETVSE